MKFQIRLHLAGEGMLKVENVTSGFWYHSLPSKLGSISKVTKERAMSFTFDEVRRAFTDKETYGVEKIVLHATRIGFGKLFRVFNPTTHKWFARDSSTRQYIWVDFMTSETVIGKDTVIKKFPEHFFTLIWE